MRPRAAAVRFTRPLDLALANERCGGPCLIKKHDRNIADSVVNYRDLPISHLGVTVNYPMEVGGESPGGQTASNGATCAGPRCLAASSLPALLVIHTASCCCAVLTTELQLLLTPGLLVGVRRQIAGTHSTHEPIVRYSEEPLEMKMSIVAPAPAGCAMIRASDPLPPSARTLCALLRPKSTQSRAHSLSLTSNAALRHSQSRRANR